MTVLLDTHAAYWWSAGDDRLSSTARRVIGDADELAVSGMTWFELAWLARRERIIVGVPVGTWLSELAGAFRTVGVSWAVAEAAAGLPATFPGDPVDRIIYATALVNGWQLVTRDGRMHEQDRARAMVVW